MHQLGTKKKLFVIFLGHALNAVKSWTCDRLIVDTEELKTMPPFEIHVTSFKSKEVGVVKSTKRCDLKQASQEQSSVEEEGKA